MAEKEFKSKYPSFGNRPSGMAKRKISAAVSGCHLIKIQYIMSSYK